MPKHNVRRHGQHPAWQHNRLIGHARMIQTLARQILLAPSVTKEARDIANIAWREASYLEEELRSRRVNPDSTITNLKEKS